MLCFQNATAVQVTNNLGLQEDSSAQLGPGDEVPLAESTQEEREDVVEDSTVKTEDKSFHTVALLHREDASPSRDKMQECSSDHLQKTVPCTVSASAVGIRYVEINVTKTDLFLRLARGNQT
jgi:hypothetical protein